MFATRSDLGIVLQQNESSILCLKIIIKGDTAHNGRRGCDTLERDVSVDLYLLPNFSAFHITLVLSSDTENHQSRKISYL